MTDIEFRAKELVQTAFNARQKAYAPYSRYSVGAAVLGDDDIIYTGCNIENAVYPLTTCAERVAITKAVSEGVKRIKAIAVVTQNGGTPCGSCRQVIREFSEDDTPIFIADLDGHIKKFTVNQLLPESFSAKDLA